MAVQSRKCYEVRPGMASPCWSWSRSRAAALSTCPTTQKAVLDALHGGSPASYAIRFAAGFPGMLMVLSAHE